MSTWLSELTQRTAFEVVYTSGAWVRLDGVWLKALTQESSGARTGTSTLNEGDYGVFIAAAEPRKFTFAALDFAPFTAVSPPRPGSELIYNVDPDTPGAAGLRYLVTRAGREIIDNDGATVEAYGYLAIDQLAEELLPMALTLNMIRSLSFGGVTVGGAQPVPNTSQVVVINEDIIPGEASHQINMPDVPVAQIVAIGFDANRQVVMNTNAADAAGGQSLTISPNPALIWKIGDPAPNFITTANLTGLWVDTSGVTDIPVDPLFRITLKGLIGLKVT